MRRAIIAVLLIGIWVLPSFSAPSITNIWVGSNGISLAWTTPTNHFIIEKFVSLTDRSNSLFWGSSTGVTCSSATCALPSNSAAFFRIKFGVESVTISDTNFSALVRRLIVSKTYPTNAIYNTDLTGFSVLTGENRSISTIDGIASMTNLTFIDLGWNSVSNISAVGSLPKLRELYLNNNPVTNISCLSNCHLLAWLSFATAKIKDISALSGLTNLVSVDVGGNSISNITALSGLKKMTSLRLWNNQITNLTPLAALTNLTELYVQGNKFTSISALTNLVNLTNLNLSANTFADVSALANMKKLRTLALNNNTALTNASPLSGLTNISVLYLGDTGIKDISALVTNAAKGGLGSGDTVWLTRLSLSDTSKVSTLRTNYHVTVNWP